MKYCGAFAQINWIGMESDGSELYFSFGKQVLSKIDGVPIADEFGVPDEFIFYYTDDVEWDILKRGQNTGDDFMIIPATIRYISETDVESVYTGRNP